MLRFDRGGAYAQVFEHCRKENVHWVTYRRAPLAVPSKLPVITAVTYAGKTRELCWSEETVQIKDYGDAQQLTLFERGQVALQILASDFGACPADLLSWLNPGGGKRTSSSTRRRTTGSTASATTSPRSPPAPSPPATRPAAKPTPLSATPRRPWTPPSVTSPP